MPWTGFATLDGTDRYRGRFRPVLPAGHFRQVQGLWLSSIGLGTALGEPDDATDRLYEETTARVVEAGCNVIDTAANYRAGRSESAVGRALRALAARGVGRDEIVVGTKGGFLPRPDAARSTDEVVHGHCLTPRFLLEQLDLSLTQLELDSLDVYYLHNPETQLEAIDRATFRDRLRRAFQALEGARAAGKLRRYGVATWNGCRVAPEAEGHLSLAELVALAREAGGEEHGLTIVQLPFNLGMTEALVDATQEVDGRRLPAIHAAHALGLAVVCSASILRGELARDLPAELHPTFERLETDGQRALQFVRSTPGVTTALVGMKHPRHVAENLGTARVSPLSEERYASLFEARGGAPPS